MAWDSAEGNRGVWRVEAEAREEREGEEGSQAKW